MTEKEAREAETTFRDVGWDVTAHRSPLATWDWELAARAADGGRDMFVPSRLDMKVLILGGAVARLQGVAS